MQLGCHRLISQDAPAGPQNAVEANGWLAFLVSRLGGVMVDRVIRNFEHGVCGYSDFSGFLIAGELVWGSYLKWSRHLAKCIF